MLVPERSWSRVGDRVKIEVRDAPEGAVLQVIRFATVVAEAPAADGIVDLGALAHGGYGLLLIGRRGDVLESTAFDVLSDAFERPRYGFVTRMTTDAPRADAAMLSRRLHLNLVQFYDWAYRHSQLLPPTDEYLDPLGQPRALSAVNALADAYRDVGTLPLGYSAVYAIGSDEVERWEDVVLRRHDGEPYRLGEDFLVLVDPGSPQWLSHYTDQLAQTMQSTSFAGFHLDQYGWPKMASSEAGRVDLTNAFRTMLEDVRRAVPDARVIFNNVNDFPTWATATAPQDATYIEVWSPHDSLQDLSDLVTRSRRLTPHHPPIISAYLSCLTGDEAGGVRAAKLTMAAVYGAGGTHLLLGETGHALVDPYYPRNVALSATSLDELTTWYDTVVRYGDLLLAPGIEDVTEFYTNGINEDVLLDGASMDTRAVPGSVWVRVMRLADGGHVIHLVNLTGVADVAWDSGKPTQDPLAGLALRATNALVPSGAWWMSADEEHAPLAELDGVSSSGATQTDALSAGQEHVGYTLPPLQTWGVIWLPADGVDPSSI